MSSAGATTEKPADCEVTAADQRVLLVAYLKYVVADVAQINATSASLLLMAIADLEGQLQGGDALRPQ